ncbi:hypothetical protein Tco_1017501 [Tanacetum coccineum]|uniref:Uncharacterized protein n=1 Tax=Tanacetum coccineum TaxID=301880 RepID=A0ABQ5FRN4_9ASTR
MGIKVQPSYIQRHTRSQPKSCGKFAQAEEPSHIVDDTKVQQNQGQNMGNTDDQPNVEAASKYDWLKKPERPPSPDFDWNIDNLTQDHLVGPAFNLLKGTCKSRVEFEYNIEECRQVVPVDYFINNDLEYLRGGSSSRKYMASTTKTKAAKYDIQGIKDMVPSLWSLVKEIEVRREDQQLYKFMEGDFPRLYMHDIEDMLLLLVQKKLSNLERDVNFVLGVALWMFTIRIVIVKRVEDHQLEVESYQKKLNITKPKTFRLICMDELYKFSNETLTSVRLVPYDIASNLRMDYLPKRRWSILDRKKSRIMIKAIDKQLLERRLMRSLEKFIGGRDYGEDLRLLQRTI